MAYTATITPNAASEGNVTVQVKVNAVTDNAGNNNTASAITSDIHIDTIVPTVSVTGFPPATQEQNGPFTLTVTFSEPVNGFAVPADLTLGLTAQQEGVTSAMPIAAATLASGDPGDSVYTVTITPNTAGSEGDVTVTVKAAAVRDLALNNNTASPETDVVRVDTIAPTVVIEGLPPGQEYNVPFDITILFWEKVDGFALDDLTVTLTPEPGVTSAPGDIATVELIENNPGLAYVARVTPNAAGAEGDVTVGVKANAVTDAAGNFNPVPVTIESAIHIDTIVPTVSDKWSSACDPGAEGMRFR